MADKKTNGRDGQHNVYSDFGKNGKHSHTFYDSKTGLMGYHGENASDEIKQFSGQKSKEITNGSWLNNGSKWYSK